MSKPIHETAATAPALDSADPADRRSSPRHEAHSLVLLLDPMDQHGDRAWMVNISEGGLAIEMPLDNAPKEDSMVMVELPLGTSISRLKTRCRVRGITKKGEDGLVHLSFLDESDLFRDALRASIEQFRARMASLEEAPLKGIWQS